MIMSLYLILIKKVNKVSNLIKLKIRLILGKALKVNLKNLRQNIIFTMIRRARTIRKVAMTIDPNTIIINRGLEIPDRGLGTTIQ
jgi:hypothetical protein